MRIEEREAAVVAEIFALYLEPQSSLGTVVRSLHERAIPVARGGKWWCITSVRNVLTNPVSTGMIYANREHPEPTHQRLSALKPIGQTRASFHANRPEEWIEVRRVPAIISQEQFDPRDSQAEPESALCAAQ